MSDVTWSGIPLDPPRPTREFNPGYRRNVNPWRDVEFTGVIVFCPVCCSNADGYQWGDNVIECTDCGTEFVVWLNPETVANHAAIG